jgi:uncharacterized membrane protein
MKVNGRDRGATLPIVALLLPILILMTAFAVDLGRQRSSRRTMQARADVVALDMVREIKGRDVTTLQSDPATQAALTAAAARGGLKNATLSPATGPRVTKLEWGTMSAVTSKFVPLPSVSSVVPDATRITTEDETDYYFQPGSGRATRTAVAQAGEREAAWFQVGSYLAGVNPASNTVIGRVLNAIIPGADVLSYNGLVGARVTLGNLLVALDAVHPGAVLDTTISYRELALATAQAVQAGGGNTAAVALLNNLASLAPTVEQVTLGQVLDIDAAGNTPAATAAFDVLGILTGAAFLADQTHAVSLPATQVNIPGVGQVDVDLGVIEAPQVGGDQVGAVASTGQVNLGITPRIDVSTSPANANICSVPPADRGLIAGLVGGLGAFLSCLTGPVNRAITLEAHLTGSINLRAAGADVTLTDIDCVSVPPRITLTPQPVPLELLNNVQLRVTGTLAGASLGDVAVIDLGARAASYGTSGPQTFQDPTEFGPPPRRVGSNPLGLGGLLNIGTSNITILNGSVALSPILQPVLAPMTVAINGLLQQVDQLLLAPIANALGLSLGGADLTALTMDCDQVNPRLVG